MSSDTGSEPRKKHRHDLGQEDHGPVIAQGTTRAIQAVLATWIIATFVLVAWLFVDVTRSARTGAAKAADVHAPAPTSSTSPTR
ncbi:MAG: hypothetical protein H6708_29760 [Kofleriaceae bacterium]|nr:hypothetical protein [Myxococcales bacterium]MCB9564591.1 hypothetical protein [Kofleriaceae bacterium]